MGVVILEIIWTAIPIFLILMIMFKPVHSLTITAYLIIWIAILISVILTIMFKPVYSPAFSVHLKLRDDELLLFNKSFGEPSLSCLF